MANLAISITLGGFNPAEAITSAGSVVTWTNKDDPALQSTHTTTSNDGLWDSGPLNAGNAFTHPFTDPGDFSYHCAIHPSETGIVKVFFPAAG
ncbi:plastocyanin [Streptomyces sp. UNOC14_S4]|uniref:plastocyanin n=1 Tax=Streptomyces sp. UNOC14_S4 TaxID=2872340 RepID=UPI001E634EC6|nr:plastocyanin [Streptomyces sp. UNOC14_S4]MCC3769165.1 plastocyanin [Streptomyces sp. UNOC14_S4]